MQILVFTFEQKTQIQVRLFLFLFDWDKAVDACLCDSIAFRKVSGNRTKVDFVIAFLKECAEVEMKARGLFLVLWKLMGKTEAEGVEDMWHGR